MKTYKLVIGFLALTSSIVWVPRPAISQESSADLIPAVLKEIKSLPDCAFTYYRTEFCHTEEAKKRRPPGSETYARVTRIDFCRFQGKFSAQFNEAERLRSQVSYDGEKYYFLWCSPKQKKLWVGRDSDAVGGDSLSTALLNNPLYARYIGLTLQDWKHFHPPYFETHEYWTQLTKTHQFVSADAKELVFQRPMGTGVGVYRVTYALPSLVPYVAMLAPDNTVLVESRITKLFTPPGGKGPDMVSKSFSGTVDAQGKPVMKFGSSTSDLDEASFRLITEPPPEGFAIPRSIADVVVETK
jgi:hypothetical protein